MVIPTSQPANQKASGTFFQRVASEIEPILMHGIVVVSLELLLLLISGILVFLKYLLPDRKQDLDYIESTDLWVALLLLCLFGSYTLLIVAIRLGKGISAAWRAAP